MLVIKNVAYIPRSICNKKQARQGVKMKPICIADTDYDYIRDGILRLDHIECERQVHNDEY